MTFSVKDSFSKCDQICRKLRKFLNGKLHFFCAVNLTLVNESSPKKFLHNAIFATCDFKKNFHNQIRNYPPAFKNYFMIRYRQAKRVSRKCFAFSMNSIHFYMNKAFLKKGFVFIYLSLEIFKNLICFCRSVLLS